MKIGIFTYGTRGDVQPYIALSLRLIEKGHEVLIAAPENFKPLVKSYNIPFHPLYGNAEEMMNAPEGRRILRSENTIKLMKYFFKVLREAKVPLRKSYIEGFNKVEYVIINSATIPITAAIAEKQNKKFVLTYFMPPVVPTKAFPLADFDLFNFPWYNKLTYKLAHAFFWKFVKNEVNEFRRELDLPELKENIITYITKQKPLDLYCLSPCLIPQPEDWPGSSKITGFISLPPSKNDTHGEDNYALTNWLSRGEKSIYMGFGSNGIGNPKKFIALLNNILLHTTERVLFCTGWSAFNNLPVHENLFVVKYVNHGEVLPKCKLGIFHGGAGTLAAMLSNNLPVVIISFYTDQPAWGKIIEKKKLGVHIALKKLDSKKLLAAIKYVQTSEIKANILAIGEQIRNENGLENAVNEIEKYFEE